MKITFLKLWNSGYFERTTSERPTCTKASILGQIVLEMLVLFCSDDSIQILSSKFDLVPNVMN